MKVMTIHDDFRRHYHQPPLSHASLNAATAASAVIGEPRVSQLWANGLCPFSLHDLA